MVAQISKSSTAAWVGPVLAALLTALPACSAGRGSTSQAFAASGGDAATAGVGGSNLIVSEGGSDGLALGGTGSSGAAGSLAVVPPWTPPASDDNCGAHCFYAPELPQSPKSDPTQLFTAAASGNAPILIYPLASSVHPLNMLSVTFQWQRPEHSHVTARIDVQGAADTWSFYVACQHVRKFVEDAHLDECVYELPHGSWGALAYANQGAEVALTITTTDGAGSVSPPSAPVAISFSDDAVQGALYYWSVEDTGNGYESGIMRAPFGAQKAESFIRPNTPANPAACGGCHALSRDGEVIAFSAGPESNSGGLTVESTSDPSQPYIKPGTTPTGVLMTLNPDGSKVLAATGDGVLDLWDTKSGTHVTEVDPSLLGGQGATHPEWSPDGAQIAITPHGSFNQEADSGCASLGNSQETRRFATECVARRAAEPGAVRHSVVVSPGTS